MARDHATGSDHQPTTVQLSDGFMDFSPDGWSRASNQRVPLIYTAGQETREMCPSLFESRVR